MWASLVKEGWVWLCSASALVVLVLSTEDHHQNLVWGSLAQ